MGNVMAASPPPTPPPPPPYVLVPAPSEEQSLGNPGTVEDLHKRTKGTHKQSIIVSHRKIIFYFCFRCVSHQLWWGQNHGQQRLEQPFSNFSYFEHELVDPIRIQIWSHLCWNSAIQSLWSLSYFTWWCWSQWQFKCQHYSSNQQEC